MTTSQKFNFPSLRRAEIAPALINHVVPVLADVIRDAAAEFAERECGEDATIFDVERIAGDLLFALADLLTLSPIPLKGVGDLLRFHQLDALHAAAYFEVDLDYGMPAPGDDDEPVSAFAETEDSLSELANSPVATGTSPLGAAVRFDDLAAAARALHLSAEQVAVLGGAGEAQAASMKCALDGCNVHFTPNRANQKFHSDECRKAYWNAQRRGNRQVPS